MSNFNKQVIEEFRANDGKVGGYFENTTLLLLHTIGAKSGLARINPLVTIEDDGRLIIVASAAGAPKSPAWYHNIVANPNVEVEFGAERFKVHADIPGEPERTELYGKMEAAFAGFTQYKEQTTRVIPIVTLTRSG